MHEFGAVSRSRGLASGQCRKTWVVNSILWKTVSTQGHKVRRDDDERVLRLLRVGQEACPLRAFADRAIIVVGNTGLRQRRSGKRQETAPAELCHLQTMPETALMNRCRAATADGRDAESPLAACVYCASANDLSNGSSSSSAGSSPSSSGSRQTSAANAPRLQSLRTCALCLQACHEVCCDASKKSLESLSLKIPRS